MVVHSVMNSIDPPGSALISQIASNLWGRAGDPTDDGNHGVWLGCINRLASGIVSSLGELTNKK